MGEVEVRSLSVVLEDTRTSDAVVMGMASRAREIDRVWNLSFPFCVGLAQDMAHLEGLAQIYLTDATSRLSM